MPIKYFIILLSWLCLSVQPHNSYAQNIPCDSTDLQSFFNLYGGTAAFSPHTVNAVNTFIQAEDALFAGDYARAKQLVEGIFATYPRGNNVWWSVFNDPNGANLGTPHTYYGLRMIEDVYNFHLSNPNPSPPSKTAKMKVVLVGCSQGVQPRTKQELSAGTGQFVTHSLDSSLLESNYCTLRQSLNFFLTYVNAITQGQLQVEVEFVELPNVCMDVSVSSTTPYFATGSIQPVWDALNDAEQDSTDWWWVLYPSHVPPQAVFDDESFITGGMGVDSKGGPVFIIDDKWISRKPPHLGSGIYNDIERRIYLPQWLQHEFFHHLYRIYPEFALEVNGHDWFNRNFWPSDFRGQFEADYYAESLHKRLQTACVPLARRLITRKVGVSTQLLDSISMEDLLGPYSLDNVLNPWHVAEVIQQGGSYFWRNSANVQWRLTPNLAEGKLETGPDSPYPGQDFFVELYQNADGSYVPGISSLKFQGEFYKKRFDLLKPSVPLEVVLGLYESKCLDSVVDRGYIIKDVGQFYWQGEGVPRWTLAADTANRRFDLDSSSPSPNESLDLILTEDDCGLYVLGFEYLGNYYWKPKRDSSNASPNLVNPISNVELLKDFGSYQIDVSGIFDDAENEELLLFASSGNSNLISTHINGQQLGTFWGRSW